MTQTSQAADLTLRKALRRAVHEEMRRDDTVFLAGQDEEDGGSFGVTEGLHDEFPNRVRNTPISEAAEIGAGIGAAATGLRPVVNLSFADFIAVCFDQLMNQAAKTRYMFGGAVDVPLVVRATEGAGLNAAAQHSGTYHSMVANLPGLKVVAPGTPAGAYGLMKSSIRSNDPVVFFENKTIYERRGPVPDDSDFRIPIGEAGIQRAGSDVTVVATQRLLDEALDAAEALEPERSVEVIDPQSIYPMDTQTIMDSLRKTGRLVIADESPLSYGFHAEVAMRALEDAFFSLDAPPQRVGVPDTPIPFAPALENEVLPDVEDIRRAIDRTF